MNMNYTDDEHFTLLVTMLMMNTFQWLHRIWTLPTSWGYEHELHRWWTLPTSRDYEQDEHFSLITQNMNTSHFKWLCSWWTLRSNYTEHEHFPLIGLWTRWTLSHWLHRTLCFSLLGVMNVMNTFQWFYRTWTLPISSGYKHVEHFPVVAENMNTSHFLWLCTWWTLYSDY